MVERPMELRGIHCDTCSDGAQEAVEYMRQREAWSSGAHAAESQKQFLHGGGGDIEVRLGCRTLRQAAVVEVRVSGG